MATVSTGPHITDETSVDQSFMDTTIMHRFLFIFNKKSQGLSVGHLKSVISELWFYQQTASYGPIRGLFPRPFI